ncbi:hypothetical protein [Chengkuizengella axinellae]|uniref:Uncharacterized protein n=1 Tax=Chengkuizengella axinellae TaxID=3064388 RepID=A0ABT9J3I1_9BACL|nr:hypothetical protein [Chengkuizengella sp. 2205SS18-9]MDP5276154.1 hypothetical protein [Chengkuizengella sp. 2205SS18-9]
MIYLTEEEQKKGIMEHNFFMMWKLDEDSECLCGGFRKHLFLALGHATPDNIRKLATVYPIEVFAFLEYEDRLEEFSIFEV